MSGLFRFLSVFLSSMCSSCLRVGQRDGDFLAAVGQRVVEEGEGVEGGVGGDGVEGGGYEVGGGLGEAVGTDDGELGCEGGELLGD